MIFTSYGISLSLSTAINAIPPEICTQFSFPLKKIEFDRSIGSCSGCILLYNVSPSLWKRAVANEYTADAISAKQAANQLEGNL